MTGNGIEAEREAIALWARTLALPAGYTRDIVDLGRLGVYWHLYRDGERVNGGLARNHVHAEADSVICARVCAHVPSPYRSMDLYALTARAELA